MPSKSETGFIMLKHWSEQISMLSLEQKGTLFDAIYRYQCRGEDFNTDDGMLKILWSTMRQTFEHNNKKYEKMCIANRENALKRWGKIADECERIRADANDADIETEKDKDKETDIETEAEEDNKNEFYASSSSVLTEDELLKKHMKQYDFSEYNDYELSKKLTFTTAGAAGFTVAESDMLEKLIYPQALDKYLIKLSDYEVNDKFKTVINWAKEDGNYRGLKYELSNNA
jgi:hypothetical protein